MDSKEARELREMTTTAREASLAALGIARAANWKANWARGYSIAAVLFAAIALLVVML
jgi:hypothetical protein